MTVSDLIDRLSRCNQDQEIRLYIDPNQAGRDCLVLNVTREAEYVLLHPKRMEDEYVDRYEATSH